MIVVYTSPGCASCRKVKAWLRERNLPFIEKNIFNVALHPNEIKYLLQRSDNGADDIISKRSKIIQQGKFDIDSMSMKELVNFIIEHPSILRRPIILNDRSFQIGFDSEEIDLFLPNRLTEMARSECPISKNFSLKNKKTEENEKCDVEDSE